MILVRTKKKELIYCVYLPIKQQMKQFKIKYSIFRIQILPGYFCALLLFSSNKDFII
jgi:hypothetical protein